MKKINLMNTKPQTFCLYFYITFRRDQFN